jgi:DNA-binding response OmpR family regulator
MALILVVDDEAEALGSIRRVLKDAGHEVLTASSGREALQVLANRQPDLVILDIIMPEMTGLEVCRRIRADPFRAKLPVIFLTARSRPNDIAEGLDAGGDDYITKPFQVIELPARIRALLRRASSGPMDVDSDYLIAGTLKLHVMDFVLDVGERRVDLTAIEHRLLHYLIWHAGRPQSVERLLENVWDYPPGVGDPALVYAHIKNLRKKIEPQPDSPMYIRNIRSQGYVVGT